jgi:integrase
LNRGPPNDGGELVQVTQDSKAKSEIFTRIRRIVRRGGLDYDGWRYVAKRVRKECSLQPARKGRRLPKVLTGDDFRRFFEALDRSEVSSTA